MKLIEMAAKLGLTKRDGLWWDNQYLNFAYGVELGNDAYVSDGVVIRPKPLTNSQLQDAYKKLKAGKWRGAIKWCNS